MEQPVKVGYVETKSVMTKSNAPLGGYSVNPYVGCPHACRYCYASFMKRFTGHTEDWGTFMDVKEWPEITNLPMVIIPWRKPLERPERFWRS